MPEHDGHLRLRTCRTATTIRESLLVRVILPPEGDKPWCLYEMVVNQIENAAISRCERERWNRNAILDSLFYVPFRVSPSETMASWSERSK